MFSSYNHKSIWVVRNNSVGRVTRSGSGIILWSIFIDPVFASFFKKKAYLWYIIFFGAEIIRGQNIENI